jgi:hypothetical protein
MISQSSEYTHCHLNVHKCTLPPTNHFRAAYSELSGRRKNTSLTFAICKSNKKRDLDYYVRRTFRKRTGTDPSPVPDCPHFEKTPQKSNQVLEHEPLVHVCH